MNDLSHVVRGIPLDAMQAMFAYVGFTAELDGNRLTFDGPNGPVEIVVSEPTEPPLGDSPLEAVVVLRTWIDLGAAGLSPRQQMNLNRMAALGAFVMRDGKPCVESRLTTCAGANPSGQYAGLLYHASLLAADALDHAPCTRKHEPGAWPGEDLPAVRRAFAGTCVCTGDEEGLSAEFSLRPGTGTAARGDERTALLQMRTLEVHPRLGPGLHVLLELPHQFFDEDRLARVVGLLNAWESEAADRPPHFGAWCNGRVRNPCYTMFLPTTLHREGHALNVAAWMRARALLANGFLLAHGIQDDAGWTGEVH
jgi:hypothetical protein